MSLARRNLTGSPDFSGTGKCTSLSVSPEAVLVSTKQRLPSVDLTSLPCTTLPAAAARCPPELFDVQTDPPPTPCGVLGSVTSVPLTLHGPPALAATGRTPEGPGWLSVPAGCLSS